VTQLGNDVTWYIPLGLREWFLKRGIENVIELDWWQEIHHKGRPDILIACVPSMHSSSSTSTTTAKDESLWCSFVIKGKQDRIYFCGDTGYVPELFQSIRDLYAPFTIAALPIDGGSSYEHMNPEKAVKAHKDLGYPMYSIGIHWGTFMTSEEPSQQLRVLWDKEEENRKDTTFVTMDFGQSLFL
jgi:N-acyl-phosphatidylethanolamine-hydrolysing phospholipase D